MNDGLLCEFRLWLILTSFMFMYNDKKGIGTLICMTRHHVIRIRLPSDLHSFILYSITNHCNYKFNIHESVHRNNILIQKSQQDAHITEFIFI